MKKKLVQLVLTTYTPQKWVAVDLETRDVWHGQADGHWKCAKLLALRKAVNILVDTLSAEMSRWKP